MTGGGAQLKHLKQLVEYITGMDTRIGYPNEHLAGDSDERLSSPMYATAVGLVMKGLREKERMIRRKDTEIYVKEPVIEKEPIVESETAVSLEPEAPVAEQIPEEYSERKEEKKTIFERWADKFREFLDNAE